MQVIYKFQGFKWCQFTTRRPNMRSTKRTPQVSFDRNWPLANAGLVCCQNVSCIRHSSSYKTIHSQWSSSGVLFLKGCMEGPRKWLFRPNFFPRLNELNFCTWHSTSEKNIPPLFCWFLFHFPEITYAKTQFFPGGVLSKESFCFSKQ